MIPDEPGEASANTLGAGIRRRLNVIPPVSVEFISPVRLFAPASSRPVEVELTAFRPGVSGTLQLDAPAGWNISPGPIPFHFAAAGQHVRLSFSVTAPAQPATARLDARVHVGDSWFGNRRIEISYRHIPLQLLQPPARADAVCLDLAVRSQRVGYVPGAGDSVAECMRQMGCTVSQLNGAQLTPNRLKDLDAVVIGIRAFNVRTDFVSQLPDLFAYVEAGGTVIAQYNRPGPDLKTTNLAPFDLHLSNDRVTDENSPITFLAPDHPALTTPNKITKADFDGWVQERGLYFPNEWDSHFTPIIACNDPGESPKQGGLLVAQYGKGYFVYTGLAWFRQLPAGVPGAYRLFANLVSLGK